jgi:hypothetical protein
MTTNNNFFDSLLTALFRPSEIIDETEESIGGMASWLISWLAAYHIVIYVTISTEITSLSLRAFTIMALISLVLTAFAFTFVSYFLSMVSRWFGGSSREETNQIVLGFASIPVASMIIADSIIVFTLGDSIVENTQIRNLYDLSTFVAIQWGLFILIKSYASINGMTLFRAILALTITVLLPVVSTLLVGGFFEAAMFENGREKIDWIHYFHPLRWLLVVIVIFIINSKMFQHVKWRFFMSDSTYYIVRNDGPGWLVRKGGQTEPIRYYFKKDDAIAFVESVRHLHSEKIAHDDSVKSTIKDASE